MTSVASAGLPTAQCQSGAVSARVSKSGQAVPAPGDLSGQSAPIANVASGVLVEINEVVKN